MGWMDKAREALEKAGPHLEKAREKAGPHLEKAREKAGPLVERAAEKVDHATGGKYSNQIDGVKGRVEGALGHGGEAAPGAGTHSDSVPPVPPAPPGGDTPRPQGNPAASQPPATPPPAADDRKDGGIPPVPPAN